MLCLYSRISPFWDENADRLTTFFFSSRSLLDQALKVFTSRPVYLPERARAIFKKSRVLHLLGRADEAAKEKEASVELLRELVDVGERTVDQVADADFDGAIVFWSK